jgi:hypothetical protein
MVMSPMLPESGYDQKNQAKHRHDRQNHQHPCERDPTRLCYRLCGHTIGFDPYLTHKRAKTEIFTRMISRAVCRGLAADAMVDFYIFDVLDGVT